MSINTTVRQMSDGFFDKFGTFFPLSMKWYLMIRSDINLNFVEVELDFGSYLIPT